MRGLPEATGWSNDIFRDLSGDPAAVPDARLEGIEIPPGEPVLRRTVRGLVRESARIPAFCPWLGFPFSPQSPFAWLFSFSGSSRAVRPGVNGLPAPRPRLRAEALAKARVGHDAAGSTAALGEGPSKTASKRSFK